MTEAPAAGMTPTEGPLDRRRRDLEALGSEAQVLGVQRRYADAIPEYEAAIALDRNAGPVAEFMGSLDTTVV